MNPPFGLQWKPSGGKGKNEEEKKLNALLEKQLEEIQTEAKKIEVGNMKQVFLRMGKTASFCLFNMHYINCRIMVKLLSSQMESLFSPEI